MKIKITTDRQPFLDDEPKNMGGFAEEVKTTEKPKRARNSDGTLKPDDKSTPDVNEAWEGGVAPE